MQTLTCDQARRLDHLAVEKLGVPSILLMENAARNVADVVLDLLAHDLHLVTDDARVAVLCGGGSNGGDGYAIARHLFNHGIDTTIYAAVNPDALRGDAALNRRITANLGVAIVRLDEGVDLNSVEREQVYAQWDRCHVLIDALLGTGFQGEVRSPLDRIITACNHCRRAAHVQVIAVDVPSGLNGDTGVPGGPNSPAIEADLTVTFVAPKAGFGPHAERYLGEVVVVDIGVPDHLADLVHDEK
jgi:NAD(P)H-hydrate epimerase